MGTFMIGLPIENQETIEETIRFAEEIDPVFDSGVDRGALPGSRASRKQATANGWIDASALQVAGSGSPDIDRCATLSPLRMRSRTR